MSWVQPADNPRVVSHTYQNHLPQPYNHGPLSIHLTTHTNTTRRYKSYHPRSSLRTRISQTSTTQITPKHQSKQTSLISRIAESFT
jgi:hypothetical protein